MELLINSGADVNTTCTLGNTPLFRAAERGNDRKVELLIGAGENVNIANKQGETSLFMAAKKEAIPVLNFCLKLLLQLTKRTTKVLQLL